MTDAFQVPVSRSTLLRLIALLPDPAWSAWMNTPSARAASTEPCSSTSKHDVRSTSFPIGRPTRSRPGSSSDPASRSSAATEPPSSPRAPPGALQALQVADRWHLWHNLGEAAEKCVYRHRGCLRPAQAQPEEAEPTALSPWPTGTGSRTHRAKHATIHALLAARHSKRSVARQLGMTLSTILRFSRATTPEEMFTGRWQSRATRLDDCKPYLDQRWREGCTNAWKLWEEIKEQGCPRGYASVRGYVSSPGPGRRLRRVQRPSGRLGPRPFRSRPAGVGTRGAEGVGRDRRSPRATWSRGRQPDLRAQDQPSPAPNVGRFRHRGSSGLGRAGQSRHRKCDDVALVGAGWTGWCGLVSDGRGHAGGEVLS